MTPARKPAARKPAAKKAAATRAAAAVAETRDDLKTVTWEGITFTTPANPPEEMLLDAVEMEATNGSVMVIGRMLRSVLGPVQFMQARNRIAELRTTESDSSQEHLLALTEAVLAPYGVTLGESEASQDS